MLDLPVVETRLADPGTEEQIIAILKEHEAE